MQPLWDPSGPVDPPLKHLGESISGPFADPGSTEERYIDGGSQEPHHQHDLALDLRTARQP